MTYRAGIGPGMATLGISPRDPHVVCDRCGAIGPILMANGDVSQTWLRLRRVRGWSCVRVEANDGGVTRTDTCPKCRKALTAADESGEGGASDG